MTTDHATDLPWIDAPREPLSAAGEARRRAIAAAAHRALRRRRWRRHGLRGSVAAAVVVLAALGARVASTSHTPGAPITHLPPAIEAPGPSVAVAAPPAPALVAPVRTDPAVVSRVLIVPTGLRARAVDDAALDDLLAEAGLPTGVMRTPEGAVTAAELLGARSKDDSRIRPPLGL